MPKMTSRRPHLGSGGRNRVWDAQNFIRSLDVFDKEVPAFNLRGEQQMKTIVGGCMTLLIFIITFSYAIQGMINLLQKKDPLITESLKESYYDAKLGLGGINFN